MCSAQKTLSLIWRNIFNPFLNLSILGKFSWMFGAFFLGFAAITYHDYYFHHQFISQILAVQSTANQAELEAIVAGAEEHERHSFIMAGSIVSVLAIISFIATRVLINLLNEMRQRLIAIRLTDENCANTRNITEIPIFTKDEIGQVSLATNDLLTNIREISLFRRTIEADETTGEIYRRLADLFRNTLNLHSYIIYEIKNNDHSISPVSSYPLEMEAEACQMLGAEMCRAKRTGNLCSSINFPGICPVFPHPDALSHACVPLIVGGRPLGVVQFLFPFISSQQTEQEASMQLLRARQYLREALPIIQAKRLAEDLHEMAITDTLTGLHNRRFLESNINTVIAGVRRRNTQLAILMCDMDYFKQVNDDYGHDTGDAVLKSLAFLLAHNVRASDIVIRYGGEEFLILLLDCHPDMAMEVAEKIRAAVERHTFTHDNFSLKKTL
ncbi:MAG: GGDEF domain-containing protein, partial [Desulfobulbaceae bacterium]|nr:GGDEF domain-containing protein [Desulfobulbaceae bacterium]